jgi:hypothetical protein
VLVNDFGSCGINHEFTRDSIIIQHFGRVHELTDSSCKALKVRAGRGWRLCWHVGQAWHPVLAGAPVEGSTQGPLKQGCRLSSAAAPPQPLLPGSRVQQRLLTAARFRRAALPAAASSAAWPGLQPEHHHHRPCPRPTTQFDREVRAQEQPWGDICDEVLVAARRRSGHNGHFPPHPPHSRYLRRPCHFPHKDIVVPPSPYEVKVFTQYLDPQYLEPARNVTFFFAGALPELSQEGQWKKKPAIVNEEPWFQVGGWLRPVCSRCWL